MRDTTTTTTSEFPECSECESNVFVARAASMPNTENHPDYRCHLCGRLFYTSPAFDAQRDDGGRPR